jgi:hypothetical protein
LETSGIVAVVGCGVGVGAVVVAAGWVVVAGCVVVVLLFDWPALATASDTNEPFASFVPGFGD